MAVIAGVLSCERGKCIGMMCSVIAIAAVGCPPLGGWFPGGGCRQVFWTKIT